MRYEINSERGILFQIEDDIADEQEIPIRDAVKVCQDISSKLAALDCECEQQGAQPCDNCGRPPLERTA